MQKQDLMIKHSLEIVKRDIEEMKSKFSSMIIEERDYHDLLQRLTVVRCYIDSFR